MKCISYSLFGYGRERHANSFDFLSYMRGLLLNIRMNRLLFPSWQTVLNVDEATNGGIYGELLSKLPITVEVNQEEPLTKMMLWRLKPIFKEENQVKTYTHVICRDLDSPATYREAQAVQYWIDSNKAAHAITDSISHTIPMLGGMIGFRPDMFDMLTGYKNFGGMFKGCDINFANKGADQTFLNRYIYPRFAQPGSDSIVQHYVLGMPNTFLSGYFNHIQPVEVPGVSSDLADSNFVAGHVGASGFYSTEMFRFLQKHKEKFVDLLEIEKQWPELAYWCKDGTFD